MAFTFQILGSSSSGNSAFLSTPETKILIDAGFTAKKLKEYLDEIGEDIEKLEAVFLTHEHGDHIAGIRGLSRNNKIHFFTNRDTAEHLATKFERPINWKLFETGTSFQFKDLEIRTFSIPHDAYDPVGYTFKHLESGQKLAWVTDLGYIPLVVQQNILDADILVLESNYDERLLDEDTKRPWSIKQRIRGRHGHLSNDAAYQFITESEEAKWREIYLVHLSKDCNNVQLVEEKYRNLQFSNPTRTITVVDPESTSPALTKPALS